MIDAPGIVVNGVGITPEQINAEVQYHPAETLPAAKYMAMQALVIRELLLQRAASCGLCDTKTDAPDEAIDKLLTQEVEVPELGPDECLRYYNNNKRKFTTSPLFEVSHILYLAPPEDDKARKVALEKAQNAIMRIGEKPDLFESIAKAESACSSGRDGGRLGQIGRGQTVPAFEAALLHMQEGDMTQEPVASEVGYHIIKVHKRAEGSLLPFEAVSEWISESLRQESWHRAIGQYIRLLIGAADISGFHLNGADSPLVQ